MTGQNSEEGNQEGHEDNESTGEEYEIGRLVTREEGAAALRQLADGVATGSVELGDDGVTVTIPEQFELEIGYEEESEVAELEVELEWSIVNGEAITAQDVTGAQRADTRGGTESGGHSAEIDAGETPHEFGSEDDFAPETDPGRRPDQASGAGDAASDATFELYRDRTKEWRWRLVHDNGNIIADSGEGYDRIASARNGLESVMRNAPGATVVKTVE